MSVAGNYTVIGTNEDGCQNTATISITELPFPDVMIIGDTTFCAGDTLVLEATGAASYVWNDGQTTSQIEVSVAGNYAVVGTSAGGCENTDNITVTELSLPDVNINGTTDFCAGDTITLEATGAISFLWNDGQTTPQIEVSATGNYSVVGASANGCENTASTTVTQLALPDLALIGDTTFCPGDTMVLEATGALSYLWSGGQTTPQIEVSAAGNYTVVGTNADGCQNTATITITALSFPDVMITGDTTFCTGDTLVLEATGAASYLWNDGQATAQIEVTSPGIYEVVGTNTGGCEGSDAITITELAIPDVSIIGNTEFCAGDTLVLEATGADAYLWNDGQLTAQIEVAFPGTYIVTGTNAEGCENEASITITDLLSPNVTIIGDSEFCMGDTISLQATGAVSYLWNDGQLTDQIEITTPGVYSVIGTSADGCENTDTINITELPLPDIAIIGNTEFCAGETLPLEATGATSYLWNDGQTTSQIEITIPGIYTVIGTSNGGCENTDTITITELTVPDITILGDDGFCIGETLTLEATGAISYLWNNGQPNAQIQVTSPGTYIAVGTNADGCENSASITVEELPLPTIEITGELNICQGDSTTLTASGADTYIWSSTATTASVTVPTPGIYSVVGTSTDGCENSADAILTELTPPIVTISGENQVCGTQQTTLTATGGISYLWSNGVATAQIIVGAGTYSVTATDANGCTGEATFTILGDNEAPELLFCPTTANGILNFEQTEVAVNWVEPIAEDNCGDDNITITQTHQPGDFFELGTTTVTYTFTDVSGNSTLCTFDVVVENAASTTFYVDTLNYIVSSDTFCIPIRVVDFEAIAGFQFTIQAPDIIQSDIFAIEAASALQGGNLNGLNSFEVAPNVYSVVWVNDNIQGLSIADSTIAFFVKMIIPGPPGTCIPLNIENSPVEIQAAQIGLPNPIVPTVIGGEICVREQVDIEGQIYKINNDPVNNVMVTLNGPGTSVEFTNPAGLYSFEGEQEGVDYTLVPEKNTNHADGVSVFDLVAINRHILFIEQITNPYLLIASDVNNTQSITIADLVDIRDLILLINTEFPNGPSWRFVPVDFVFPNPINPWQTPFPEQVELLNLDTAITIDFYGIKMGDINLDAVGLQGEDETFGTFIIEDQEFAAGELVAVTLSIADARKLAAIQFELTFDPDILLFEDLQAGNLPHFDRYRSVNYKQVDQGLLPMVWFDEKLNQSEHNASLVTLNFRANRAGKLSEVIGITQEQLRNLAVTSDLRATAVKLRFANSLTLPDVTHRGNWKQLYCAPNPFGTDTELVFQLTHADWVTISLFDASGRLLNEEKRYFEAGLHYFKIDNQLLHASGIYNCRVQSSDSIGTLKLLKQ